MPFPKISHAGSAKIASFSKLCARTASFHAQRQFKKNAPGQQNARAENQRTPTKHSTTCFGSLDWWRETFARSCGGGAIRFETMARRNTPHELRERHGEDGNAFGAHGSRQCVQAVKEMNSKSIGLCPQGFESPRCRLPLPVADRADKECRITFACARFSFRRPERFITCSN